DLTMSSAEEEYGRTNDEEEFESNEGQRKGHLSTSVTTISARVRFKCRSVLVKLCEIYLILIEVPHLKQKLKATNLMSLFDCKIGNSDNQVIVSMVERCIDIPGLGALTAGVTFPHVEFPTGDFSTQKIQIPPPRLGYDYFAMTEGMRKLTLNKTLDLEARHLHSQSPITHLTTDLRRAEYRLSQLNDYLDGKGVVVDWEDDESEAGIS
ncbi:hypothetical protein GIB67_018381, partial [Kingdonia uniflora]